MGNYSSSGSVYELLKVRIYNNNNSEMLSSFEKENKKEDCLNSFLVFDKDFNLSKFYIKEIDLDIKDYIKEEHIKYYKNLYDSGERVVNEDFLIEFDVSGYYDPGRISGPPEDCYPPEGDEERILTGCMIEIQRLDHIFLPESCFDKVYNIFEDAINNKDVSYDNDYYDYDDAVDNYCDEDRYP